MGKGQRRKVKRRKQRKKQNEEGKWRRVEDKRNEGEKSEVKCVEGGDRKV